LRRDRPGGDPHATEPLTDAIEAYRAFDRRESGWIKVELKPNSKERDAV
jgi:threonine dehydrogenase-like Zn-dependent dehydrogenase